MKKFLMHGVALAVLAVPAVAILPTAAYAQDTTSAIRGTVTAEGGTAIAGATVTITNAGTGTTSVSSTGESGAFSASGLRPGGPYIVKVNAPGYDETQVTDINITVAEAFDIPIVLTKAGNAIVVTASRIPNARSVSQGPATVLNAEAIANVATVNRDIRDLMRRDPFARLDDTPGGGRAVSFAGQNARFNKFSVDGVAITDNFGINPDGLPSRRSPIPLDAIGQFQTKVAPYDVREGNFQGGSINIILRSGTNDFQGTAFGGYSSDKLAGKKTKPGPGIPTGVLTLPKYTYKNFGAELSGPIIKDKVFFMIAGERLRASLPIAEGPTDNNAGTAIPGLTQATVDNVISIAKSKYNYDAGNVLQTNGDSDDRLVAKLDFNLSDSQRLSVTGSYAKDKIFITQNTFTTPPPGLGLSSNAYVQGNLLYTGNAQLNSKWSDSFSTEVRGFYKYYKRLQDPLLGRGFAQFRVCTAPTSDRTGTGTGTTEPTSCATGVPIVSFGPDTSRQTNALNTKSFGGTFQARLTMNDHDARLFAEYSHVHVYDAFLQNSAGNYYFDSLADFAAGNAGSLTYQNAVPSLNPDAASAIFDYNTFTFGVQDNWHVTDTLNVSYGMRYDLYGSGSRAALNPNFVARYGYPNNDFLNGRGLFQPRFGFDWKPLSRLSIRGGGGIFGGGTPDVYMANSFSVTGILTNSQLIRQQNDGTYNVAGLTNIPGGLTAAQQAALIGAAALTNVNGRVIPTAVNNYIANGAVLTSSTTNALDPNFKIPSQWRATLSTDYRADLGPLGDRWMLGFDLLYSKVRDNVLWTDIRSVPIAGSLTPDGRQRYNGLLGFSDTNNDLLLTNTKLGRSYVGVARVRKSWDFGLDGGLSFIYQNIKDQTPATSSTASSNYGNGAFLDANRPSYGISNDQVKYAFKYDFTFSHAFFGDYKTTIALFGETRIGRPYSFTMFDPASGRSPIFGVTGSGSRYLLYVPTDINDPKISYADATVNGSLQTAAAAASALDSFINSSGLSKYRGKIAPRNAFNSKWFTRFDLHLAQEIPVPGWSKSKIQIFADIENVTNLINKNWGQIREYSFPYTFNPIRVACLTTAGNANNAGTKATASTQPCAQYQYSSFTTPSDTVYPKQSLYSIRIGARFSF